MKADEKGEKEMNWKINFGWGVDETYQLIAQQINRYLASCSDEEIISFIEKLEEKGWRWMPAQYTSKRKEMGTPDLITLLRSRGKEINTQHDLPEEGLDFRFASPRYSPYPSISYVALAFDNEEEGKEVLFVLYTMGGSLSYAPCFLDLLEVAGFKLDPTLLAISLNILLEDKTKEVLNLVLKLAELKTVVGRAIIALIATKGISKSKKFAIIREDLERSLEDLT